MEFLDNSGHIFSLPSYKEEPIGYEFEENKYIFWVESSTNDLSINNYYCKIINVVIPFNNDYNKNFDELVDIQISIDSNKFWLLDPTNIQNVINGFNKITDFINIDNNSNIKKNITNDDLFVLSINKNDELLNNDNTKNNWPSDNLAIIPLYVLSNSKEEGTWMTNILIHVNNKTQEYDAVEEDWCPITVGALYLKENEILTINGQNLGISLPKDIFKSVYQCSFINDEFNETLYNEKIKEYIINYMSIKGEVGNYRSAINSLKWFGYGNKIILSKLIKTDNEIKDQYINHNFNIINDLIKSFRYFRNSTLLSLKVKDNQETEERYNMNLDDEFFGEGKPILENLFDKLVEVEEGLDNNKWTYWKPFYDYSFYEMGLKLSCLQYYYEIYFLPIHIKLHSASIVHQVFANDIKFNNYVYNTNITESIINLEDSYDLDENLNNDDVEFDSNIVRYFTNQLHYVDSNFNEFYGFDESDDIYKINETCLNVPIHFKKMDKLYNCVLLLEKEKKENEYIHPYQIKLLKYPINLFYYDIEIIDTNNKSVNLNNLAFSYSIPNTNKYSNFIYGIDNFKTFLKNHFKIILNSQEFDNKPSNIEFDDNLNIILSKDTNNNLLISEYFNTLEIKGLFSTESINTVKDWLLAHNPTDTPQELNTEDWYVYLPSIHEFNTNPMDITDIVGTMYIIPKFDLVIKYDQTELNNLYIYNDKTKISLLNNIKINYIKETTSIFESHFSFIQRDNQENTKYHSFVLYPKILNDKNINYFVDQKFTLRLLVNNKWYTYNFTSKMPDLHLDFGTLKYKYWETTDNYYSKFSQLADIRPNTEDENGYIQFNSFMYEPDFVNVNHINYDEDINTYIKLNNLIYINSDYADIQLGNFNKYIELDTSSINGNKMKIYFHKNIDLNNEILSDIYIDQIYINNYKSIRIIDENNIYAEQIDNEFLKINNYNSNGTYLTDMFTQYEVEKLKLNENSDEYNELTKYENYENSSKDNIEIFNKYGTLNTINDIYCALHYIFNYQNKVIIHQNNINSYDCAININISDISDDEISEKPKANIMLNYINMFAHNIVLHDINNIYQKYDNKININIYNKLNNIHIFDIYAPYSKEKNIINAINFGNVNISANGITFTHYNNEDKIYVNGGTIWQDDVDSRYVDLYGFYWNEIERDIENGKFVNFERWPKEEEYMIYLDKDGIPSNSSYKQIKADALIGTLYVDKLNDLYNINNITKVNDFENNSKTYSYNITIKYIDTFGHLEYITNNHNAYIKMVDKFGEDLYKNIYVKIRYFDKRYYDNNEHEYTTELFTISNINALKILNNVKIDNIVIKIEFYEKIDTVELNTLVDLVIDNNKVINGTPEYKVVTNNDDEYIFYDESKKQNYIICETDTNEQISIYLINKYNSIHVDQRNRNIINPEGYIIPMDYISNISEEFKGNPQYYGYNAIYDSNTNKFEYVNELLSNESDDTIATYWNDPTEDLDIHAILNNKDYTDHQEINNFEHTRSLIIKKEFTLNNLLDSSFITENDLDGDKIKLELEWETNDNRIFIRIEIVDANGNKRIITSNHQVFTLRDGEIATLYFFIYHNNGSQLIIDHKYIIPKLYIVKHGYEQLRYNYSEDDYDLNNVLTIGNNQYFYGNNTSKSIVDLYNEFFEVEYFDKANYIGKPIDKNYLRDINDKSSGIIYEAEKIYQLEQQYNIWNTKHTLEIDNTASNNYVVVYYNDICDKYIKVDDVNIIDKINEQSLFNESNNIINMIKFDFSIHNKVNYYDCIVKRCTNNYEEIIKTDDSYIDNNFVKVIRSKVNLDKYLDYDFYLMHDLEYWYGVFISKETINKSFNVDQLKIKEQDKIMYPQIKYQNNSQTPDKYIIKEIIKDGEKKIVQIKVDDDNYNESYINYELEFDNSYLGEFTDYEPGYYNHTPYQLRYLRSGNEFLINRMAYVSNNSINHFNSNDMIVGKILSNNNLPVNIFDSTKWEITPMSIGMDNNIKINTNSEMCLLSFPETNSQYNRGYYNVNVRYSLDANTQQQYIKTGKIRIG